MKKIIFSLTVLSAFVIYLILNTSFYAPYVIVSGEPFRIEVSSRCFCIWELLEL